MEIEMTKKMGLGDNYKIPSIYFINMLKMYMVRREY